MHATAYKWTVIGTWGAHWAAAGWAPYARKWDCKIEFWRQIEMRRAELGRTRASKVGQLASFIYVRRPRDARGRPK